MWKKFENSEHWLIQTGIWCLTHKDDLARRGLMIPGGGLVSKMFKARGTSFISEQWLRFWRAK